MRQTDEELLAYANKHFILGAKFISHISDSGNERECKYFHLKQTSFKWRIYPRTDGGRGVYCDGAMNSEFGFASNPYIYTDKHGWCEITFDASNNNILEEAKRRFPIGTKFNSLRGYMDCVIKDHNFIHKPKDTYRTIEVKIALEGTDGGSTAVIYSIIHGEQWADILSLPKITTSGYFQNEKELSLEEMIKQASL